MRNHKLLIVVGSALLMLIGALAAPASGSSISPRATAMQGHCSFHSSKIYAQGTHIGLGKCNTEELAPATNTPNGYLLRSGTRVKSADGNYYVYKTYSDASYELNSNGDIVSMVKEWWKETAIGKTSNVWTLQMYDDYQYGNHYEAFYDYYCGINVSGSDPTCDTWGGNSGASGTAHGTMWTMGTHRSGTSSPFSISKNFGSKSGKKFPMFNNRIQWSDGVRNIGDDFQWGYKIRGWDVCDTVSTTRLCDTSGDGR